MRENQLQEFQPVRCAKQRELDSTEICVIGHVGFTSQFMLALYTIRPYLYNFPQNKLLFCDNIVSRSLGLIVTGINFARFLFLPKKRDLWSYYRGGNFAELECMEMETKVKEKSLRRLKI
jgi:hypothetical protein